MWNVAALYCFTTLENPADIRPRVKEACAAHGILGTLILAEEGINGTIAAESRDQLETLINILREMMDLSRLELKFSTAQEKPFLRLKIKHKKEIVTMRESMAQPAKNVGTYVAAADWNDLLNDPDIVLIDTRNDYEVIEGTFEGALNPKTQSFGQFADFIEKNLDPNVHKKVAMFCTGGIRCEKASSYMKAKGFPEVYHLKGGILKYLEDVPQEESKWHGRCYVFDYRETLTHGLRQEHCEQPWGREKRTK
ncbi:MAG TPA: rhodanese-related sulfurtransferase [Alphaproteobacteria bacterium]